MKTALLIFVAIGTAFIVFEKGFALKCFVCNSFHQADCIDWFDNVTQHLVQCPDGYGKCRKVVQEVWVGDHWDVRYIRQCANEGEVGMFEGRMCLERYGSYNVRMRYCHCDNQDGCNTASPLLSKSGFSQFLPFIVTVIAILVPFVLAER